MFDWLSRAPVAASTVADAHADGIALVVGLGNPGPEYQRTRHNVGFLAVDRLANRHGFAIGRKFKRSVTGSWISPAGPVVVARPQTFMNASGESVAAIVRFYHLAPSRILVICDDVALPFGKLRIRPGGSEGGHNGLRSLTKCLGARDYPRLRIGVGAPPGRQPMVDYVLGAFPAGEWAALPDVLDRAVDAIETGVTAGVETAMSRFNGG